MTGAWNDTNILNAPFSGRTIFCVTTDRFTVTSLANVTTTVQITGTVRYRTDTSVFGISCTWTKLQRACANRFLIDDVTCSIWSTCRNTRVNTSATGTHKVIWAIVISARATSLGTTPSRVRISDLAGCTAALVSVRTRLTDGGCMTRVRIT